MVDDKEGADPGWNYCTLKDKAKNTVQCNFCSKVTSSGITRQKQHLAGTSKNVKICPNVPEEVKTMFREMYDKKKEKESMPKAPHFDDIVDLDEEEEEDDDDLTIGTQFKGKRQATSSIGSTTNTSKKVKGPLDMHFFPEGKVGKKGGNEIGSQKHKDVQKQLRLNAIQKFCRWMYDAGIPFNAVKYDSLGPALQAITEIGCGMKPPSYHEVRVPMLMLELAHTKKFLKENEVEMKAHGCSLMADGWRDRKGRALINFLVNTPRGSMFIESVDASSYSHTGKLLSKF